MSTSSYTSSKSSKLSMIFLTVRRLAGGSLAFYYFLAIFLDFFMGMIDNVIKELYSVVAPQITT